MNEPVDPLPSMERLRWRCRRGLLELDLLFEAYLENGYASASQQEKADFVRLLEYQDQSLQEWLLGTEEAGDATLNPIIQRIRDSI